MKEKLVAISISAVLLISMVLIAMPVTASPVALPDYEPVDWQSGAGSIMSFDQLSSTPEVGTWVWDWYLYAISDGEYPYMQLRACVGNVEVWVAQNESLMFPPGDLRNDDPLNWYVTDEMCEFIAEEFNTVIYPTDTYYFGAPFDRDGTGTIFEWLGWPEFTYDWIATDNPQRVIIKIFNIRDANYYDPEYPYYVVGFFSSTYTSYYNRNMIHIDNWRYWQRLGPEGYIWYPEHPELNVTRPHVYESTIAHEYQHNIHHDWNPADDTFMNEGCSMYAELVCGYGIEPAYFNFYFGTPDNSLTVWGDQGDINILADYGVAALWTVYLSDHYGGGDFIRYFVQSGIPGIEGINAALEAFGYKERFDDVYRDWRLANLIRSDFPGEGKYNYKSIDLNIPEIIPVRIYEIEGLPVPWTKGTDFGTTKVWHYGYDTGIAEIGPYGTDYIKLYDWKKPGLIFFDGDDVALYGWRLTEEGYWWSNGENLMDAFLVGEAYVDPTDSTLTLVTSYDIEDYWDFGFVQVSTDGGETWTSLENEYTTYDHDPSAHPNIIANLPGLTGRNPEWPSWTTMTFNLSAYAGETVLIGFRYMTDWAVLYEGWYIASASVSGVELTLTPVYPEADFQVTVVYAYIIDGKTLYIPYDMWLWDETETGVTFSLTKKPHYTILVVSPTMEKGWVDYQFKATQLKSPGCKGRIVKSMGTLTKPIWRTETDGEDVWAEGY